METRWRLGHGTCGVRRVVLRLESGTIEVVCMRRDGLGGAVGASGAVAVAPANMDTGRMSDTRASRMYTVGRVYIIVEARHSCDSVSRKRAASNSEPGLAAGQRDDA